MIRVCVHLASTIILYSLVQTTQCTYLPSVVTTTFCLAYHNNSSSKSGEYQSGHPQQLPLQPHNIECDVNSISTMCMRN